MHDIWHYLTFCIFSLEYNFVSRLYSFKSDTCKMYVFGFSLFINDFLIKRLMCCIYIEDSCKERSALFIRLSLKPGTGNRGTE